ncbi:MAG: GtrA family protein [Bacilli bacterium]
MIETFKNNFFNKKFIVFVIIGIINTINHNIIYLILLNLFNLNYLLSNLVAFITSMIISFLLNSFITFKKKPTIKTAILFPLSNIPTLIFGVITSYVYVNLLKGNENFAGLLASICAIPFSFIIMKIIFNKKDN